MHILTSDHVVLRAVADDKVDAIRQAGVVLVRAGCVAPAYVDGMLARERAMSTYLGNGIAIPHGELVDLQWVDHTGLSVVQFPNGIEWEPGERAYLVIGLASKDLLHMEVLRNIVDLLQNPTAIPALIDTSDPMVIVKSLQGAGGKQNGNRDQ
jgi:mannitol PTS system EIIA component